VSYTIDGATTVDAPAVEVMDGQPITVSIPDRGVLTVYGKRPEQTAGTRPGIR